MAVAAVVVGDVVLSRLLLLLLLFVVDGRLSNGGNIEWSNGRMVEWSKSRMSMQMPLFTTPIANKGKELSYPWARQVARQQERQVETLGHGHAWGKQYLLPGNGLRACRQDWTAASYCVTNVLHCVSALYQHHSRNQEIQNLESRPQSHPSSRHNTSSSVSRDLRLVFFCDRASNPSHTQLRFALLPSSACCCCIEDGRPTIVAAGAAVGLTASKRRRGGSMAREREENAR